MIKGGDEELGRRLRLARKCMGLSLNKLGKLAGVKGAAIFYWEKGRSMPNALALYRVCCILDIEIGTLLHGIGEEPDEVIHYPPLPAHSFSTGYPPTVNSRNSRNGETYDGC